jgi:hypothetical protein
MGRAPAGLASYFLRQCQLKKIIILRKLPLTQLEPTDSAIDEKAGLATTCRDRDHASAAARVFSWVDGAFWPV